MKIKNSFLTICFEDGNSDCIYSNKNDINTEVSVTIGSYDSDLESKVLSNVPTITGQMSCSVTIELKHLGKKVSIVHCYKFYNLL